MQSWNMAIYQARCTVMRDGHALIEFLLCFTNGYREELERNAVRGN